MYFVQAKNYKPRRKLHDEIGPFPRCCLFFLFVFFHNSLRLWMRGSDQERISLRHLLCFHISTDSIRRQPAGTFARKIHTHPPPIPPLSKNPPFLLWQGGFYIYRTVSFMPISRGQKSALVQGVSQSTSEVIRINSSLKPDSGPKWEKHWSKCAPTHTFVPLLQPWCQLFCIPIIFSQNIF